MRPTYYRNNETLGGTTYVGTRAQFGRVLRRYLAACYAEIQADPDHPDYMHNQTEAQYADAALNAGLEEADAEDVRTLPHLVERATSRAAATLGRKGFNVSIACRNDSDYARAEIVTPTDPVTVKP